MCDLTRAIFEASTQVKLCIW